MILQNYHCGDSSICFMREGMMKKNLYVIFVLLSIVCIGTMWNNDCFGKETVEQKNSTDVIVDNFSGNMLNEKGIILKWSKVQKSKGYVIYRNSKKIATI